MSSLRTVRVALVLCLAVLGPLARPLEETEPKRKAGTVELRALGCNPSDEAIAELFRSADQMVGELMSALEDKEHCVSLAAARVLSYALPQESAAALEQWRIRQNGAVLHMPIPVPLGPGDFQRLEEAFREYGSGGRMGQIPRSDLISAYVFALALDRSPRAQRLLEELERLTKKVASIESDVLRRDVELALRTKPRRLMRGKNLETMLRRNLFFVSEDSVVDSVRFLAVSVRGDRALLSVDTGCGSLCGGGYHVVLEKTPEGWRYALIVITWLS